MPCRLGDETLTVTPGSGKPWLSVTRPEIVPVVVCAAAVAATKSVAASASHVLSVRMRSASFREKSQRSGQRTTCHRTADRRQCNMNVDREIQERSRSNIDSNREDPNGAIRAIQPIE